MNDIPYVTIMVWLVSIGFTLWDIKDILKDIRDSKPKEKSIYQKINDDFVSRIKR
jgi:hypothetical protein